MKAAIAEALPLFFDPDDVLEVRALDAGRPGRKVAGFLLARNVPAMAGKIAAVAADAGGVYFTPQRLDPAVLDRCRHSLVEVAKDRRDGRGEAEARPRLTHDEDVTARRFLLIDVDPVRPAGVCATDAEKCSAFGVADGVRTYLAGRGWRPPVVVDSGNGVHLYYRLPEPLPGGKVDSAADPLAITLRGLKARFDTPAATIDPSVFNASRIMKVPGTMSRKGEHTPARPHRTCTLLDVPHDWRS